MRLPVSNKRGFTLTEVLVILIIIATLAALAIISFGSIVDRAKRTSSISMLNTIRTEMETYLMDKKKYPDSINFTYFTDQDNNPILHVIAYEDVQTKIYSFISYTAPLANQDSYTLKVSAIDSNHTLLTLTNKGVTY